MLYGLCNCPALLNTASNPAILLNCVLDGCSQLVKPDKLFFLTTFTKIESIIDDLVSYMLFVSILNIFNIVF